MADHQESPAISSSPRCRRPLIQSEGLNERDIEAAQQLMQLSESETYTTTTTTSSTGSNKNTQSRNGNKKMKVLRSGTVSNKAGKSTTKDDHQKYRTLVDLYNATRPIEGDRYR